MTSPLRIAAIILAAGESKRFGAPKQLHAWQGRPLLRHVICQAMAAPVSEIVVVLGAYAAQVAPITHGLPVTLAVNRTWAAGMSGSVKIGLRALRDEVDGALFLLADQPRVTPELLTRLIQAHAAFGSPIVAPRARGRQGNPVFFARSIFPELMRITGDQGGRAVIARRSRDVFWLDVAERILFDIDTPGDLART